MNNLPEATTPALDRQDVLDAIDCEITHRESILSRHGISTWGIIAATCALLWAAATEALSARHNWTNAFLVMLACNWVLGFLASPWLKALGIGNLKGDSAYSVKELILRFGIQAGSIPYHVVHTGLLLIVALYV